ncbi:hypothetical protein AZE42_09636 [Rhizopogon vesiculosus]|uniref:Uncharacterized protein n=1 Tax=Rhizopogon vesiculosus TaxID=180088 RepID=A0A1J8Q925_9AGAM|nr:hypothetical protein AZE42_09636 [Rhizopogon vesiculosus]
MGDLTKVESATITSRQRPVLLTTPGDAYGLDDTSGSLPPPSSSPVTYEEPFPCEDKIEEVDHSYLDGSISSGFLQGPTGATPRAEARIANFSGRQKTEPQLLNEPLDHPSHVIGVQITDILGNSLPSTGFKLEKLMTMSSISLLTSLAHHSGSMLSERLIIKTQSTTSDARKPDEEPPMKKARTDRLSSHCTDLPKLRTSFSAKDPASLRRAQSLVSQTTTDRDDEDVVKLLDAPDSATSPILPSSSQLGTPICPPTVQITALPDTAAYLRAKRIPLYEFVLPNIPLKRGRAINDIFDQLDTCPNPRFQAVHLFHRYFLRVAEKQPRTSVSTNEALAQAVRGSDDTSANRPGSSSDDNQDGDDYKEAPGSDHLTQDAGEATILQLIAQDRVRVII